MARKEAGGATIGERPFHHIQARAFCHATEEPRQVQAALARVVGVSLEGEDAKRFQKGLQDTPTEGHYHNPIHIYEYEVTRGGDVRRFWQAALGDANVRERLEREIEQRLDDDLVFWIRFDKQAAARGELRLSDGQDIIQVRAKLATYPKDRDVGLAFLRDFLASS